MANWGDSEAMAGLTSREWINLLPSRKYKGSQFSITSCLSALAVCRHLSHRLTHCVLPLHHYPDTLDSPRDEDLGPNPDSRKISFL